MIKTDQTTIEVGDKVDYATSLVWTAIANVTDIPSLPGLEADDIETTTLTSPDSFKEYDPGRAEGGEVEFTLHFEKEETDKLYGLFRVKRGFRVVVPDATLAANRSMFKFTGYIKAISPETDAPEGIEVTCTIKVSGKPLFVKGAGDPVTP